MILEKISDNFVFKALKYIKCGHLKLTNYNGNIFYFGNNKENLKAEIKVNKPGFTLNVIKKGSIGLAESYMAGEFETNNLSNLIELTARNIDVVHQFSGILDFPTVNYLKNNFLKIKIGGHNCIERFFYSVFLEQNGQKHSKNKEMCASEPQVPPRT